MQTIIDKLKTVSYDAVIERGLVFLLIFTPLAMGTVQDWSIAVMETAVLIIFCAWLLKSIRSQAPLEPQAPEFLALKRLLLFFFLIFSGIAIFQIIPLPGPVLGFISPKSSALYRSFTDDPPGAWRTISISRDASIAELFKLLSYALVFMVIIHHYDTEAKIKALFRTIVYMGCFLAVFAVVQMITGNGRLLWVFPMWPGAHPMGTYVNKNHFAGYMEMAVPVGLGLFLYTASRMKGISGHADVQFAKRVASFLDNEKLTTLSFGLVSVVIMTGALFLTLSRSAIAGFMVSMVFFAGMVRTRRSLRKKWNYIVLIGILIAVSIIASSWGMIASRFEDVAGGGNFKMDVWNDATAVIEDFPVLGTGFGTFSRIYPAYQTKYPQWFFDHAENDYLELLTDTGFTGCAALAGGSAVFLYSLVKRWRKRHNTYVVCAAAGGIASIIAMLIHSITDFNMRIPANALLLTVIAAATCATVFNIQTQRHEKDARQVNAEKADMN